MGRAAVCGEKGADAGVGVAVEVVCADAVVAAEEYCAGKGDGQDEPDKVFGGEPRAVDVEMSFVGQAGERCGEGAGHGGQSQVVKRPSERGEASDLADDKASELEHTGLHDAVKELPGEGTQLLVEWSDAERDDRALRPVGVAHRRGDELLEQGRLVGEVLVDGLL